MRAREIFDVQNDESFVLRVCFVLYSEAKSVERRGQTRVRVSQS